MPISAKITVRIMARGPAIYPASRAVQTAPADRRPAISARRPTTHGTENVRAMPKPRPTHPQTWRPAGKKSHAAPTGVFYCSARSGHKRDEGGVEEAFIDFAVDKRLAAQLC